jgi:hypothetical protein
MLLLLGSIAYPEKTKVIRDSLGEVLTAIIAIAIGGFLYVAYRSCYDLVVYWIHYLLHYLLGRVWNSKICKLNIHREVSCCDGLNAYRIIRDHNGHDDATIEQFRRFEVEHSELHMLYVTSFLLIVISAFDAFVPTTTWNASTGFAVALLLFVVAMIRDIALCSREAHFVVNNIVIQDWKDKLRKTELISSSDGSRGFPA